MINLSFSNGKVFLWNANDICLLRKEYRIVGALVGCNPSKPFQNQTKWLPLQLLPEEAKLLIEKGIAQLVSSPDENPDQSTIDSYYEKRNSLCEQQIALMKENRKKVILEKADEIFEGKKRKLLCEKSKRKKKDQQVISPEGVSVEISQSSENNPDSLSGSTVIEEENSNLSVVEDKEINAETSSNLMRNNEATSSHESHPVDVGLIDKNTLIEEELTRVPDVTIEQCMVQLFTECAWKGANLKVVQWKYPVSEVEKLRCAVFKDLWERQFYITSASKFGGDFLAYEGDPLKYHALYIIVCVPRSAKLQAIELLVYGRLGNQVKKTVVLASITEAGEVEYISINWAADLL